MTNSVFKSERFSPLDKIIYHWRRRLVRPYLKSNQKVCDLGAGESAYFLKEIEGFIKSGLGLDIIVDKNYSTPKISLKQANLEEPLPVKANSMDTVFSLAVIEHLHNHELHINEIRRILGVSGRLILTTPSPISKPILEGLSFLGLINKESIADHKHYFTKKELISLARGAGFRKIRFKYFQLGANQLLIADK